MLLRTILLKLKLKGDNSLPVFIICLVIAIVFWILNSLNKIYAYPFQMELKTSSMPYSKRIANKIPEHIQVMLRGRGYELLWFNLKHGNSHLSIDLSGRNSISNKLGLSMTSEFTRQFRPSIGSLEVLYAVPDSATIFLSSKYQKKVAIRPELDFTIKKNFGLFGPVRIQPDSIYISGEKSIIDKISHISTRKVEFDELDKSVQTELELLVPDKTVLLSTYSASLTIPIDAFIENKLQLPVKYKDQQGKRLLTIPDKVAIIYKVPLQYYDQLPLDSFAISVVSDEALTPGKLNVIVTRSPKRATVISVVPSVVNYFMEK